MYMVVISLSKVISIHVPTRGTTIGYIFTKTASEFQSTCPRGARLIDYMPYLEMQISIHVPTRGTTATYPVNALAGDISIHVPTRGTTFCFFPFIVFSDFNPRAHEGHDGYCGCKSSKLFISIHVPTRGTTTLTLRSNTDNAISIHVPTRGTTITGFRPLIMFHFNPRAHEGHDVSSALVTATNAFQSTCPRGARPPLFATVTRFKPFQSTCPRGARRDTPYNYLILQFQSTCPRGARRQR